ncbi:MAG: hypothetical protein AAFQ66_20300 [Pseudomonadota bacterium]
MRFLVCAVLSLWAAGMALAEEPMSAEEFDAYTQGKTLYFYNNGQAYGVEQYLPNRRVRWSFLDGQCKDGSWYQEGQFICFLYEDRDDPQCWTFFRQGTGLRALFENDPQATELYEAGNADDDMLCLGPDVGV